MEDMYDLFAQQVVSLGGLLSSLPIENRIDREVLPAVGVEFKSGRAKLSGPKSAWPQPAVGES